MGWSGVACFRVFISQSSCLAVRARSAVSTASAGSPTGFPGSLLPGSEPRKFTASEAIVRVPTTSAALIDEEPGVVVGGRLGGVLVVRGDAEEDVQAGSRLGEEGEVLGRPGQRARATLPSAARFSTGAIRSVSASSLTVVSYIRVDGHLRLRAGALGDLLRGEPDVAVGLPRTFSSYVRMVPVISTVSGTMLGPVPPLIVPMVTTAGDAVRLAFRLTTVCRPEMTRAEVVIGSTVFHGMPPCPCLPGDGDLQVVAARRGRRRCGRRSRPSGRA